MNPDNLQPVIAELSFNLYFVHFVSIWRHLSSSRCSKRFRFVVEFFVQIATAVNTSVTLVPVFVIFSTTLASFPSRGVNEF